MSLGKNAFAQESSSNELHKRGAPFRFQIFIVANDFNTLYVLCPKKYIFGDANELNGDKYRRLR